MIAALARPGTRCAPAGRRPERTTRLLEELARRRGVRLGQLPRHAGLGGCGRGDPLHVRRVGGLLAGVGERERVLLVRVDERAGELLAGVDRLVVVLANALGVLLEVLGGLLLGGGGHGGTLSLMVRWMTVLAD